MGGDQRSHQIKAQADLIVSRYEARPGIYLHKLRAALAERGLSTSTSGLSRFFARHRITRKRRRCTRPSKSGRTWKDAREDWFASQETLDPDRLVFIDEIAAATNMTRRYGWVPRGQHYKTTTVTAALRTDGLCAVDLADGATNRGRFRAYVSDILAPVLRSSDKVILDNLGAHKVAGGLRRSRRRARGSSTSRPTHPTSSRSSRSSPSSSAYSGPGQPAPSPTCGLTSGTLSPPQGAGVPQLPRRSRICRRRGRCYMIGRSSSGPAANYEGQRP